MRDKITVIDGDIRDYKQLFKHESMDLVVANPPYRNSGNVRQIGTAACHEVTSTLEDFLKQKDLLYVIAVVLIWYSYRNDLQKVWSYS